jgi:hypothetical protein
MIEKKKDTVRLNEEELTSEEFEEKKKQLEKKPGVTVVQTNESTFRSRIKG